MSWMSRMVRRGRRDEEGNPPPVEQVPAERTPIRPAVDEQEARAQRREKQRQTKRKPKRG